MKKFIFIFALLFIGTIYGQSPMQYKSWNPSNASFPVIGNQGWFGEMESFYDRFPLRAKKIIRQEVWNLSKNSAGLQLRFNSNATDILIKMVLTKKQYQLYHMPSTGVSGLDLYTKNIDGKWLWCSATTSFKDTIEYHFTNLVGNDQHVKNRSYTLYLPLYNSVEWMEIKVPETSTFEPLPVLRDKPIVVYGTSIAQGACASRPGLAWTNILSRKVDYPVINLAFSGNGRLEKEVLDLVNEMDAKLFVLDCLPNLIGKTFTPWDINSRIVNAIIQLQSKHQATPILLVEHDGYTNEFTNVLRQSEYKLVNVIMKKVVDSLQNRGIKNIYLLTKEDINQDIESMVDGTHPNDIGMMHYAQAYEKIIRSILKEPVGSLSTQIPSTQRRDANSYDWETRHYQILDFNKTNNPSFVFIGNSITHYWGGQPNALIQRGQDSWLATFGSLHPVNMGFGWDRIENVLWRMYHGELDGLVAKTILVNIGTNNLDMNTDEEIVAGLQQLLSVIQSKQQTAIIMFAGIYPRRQKEARIVILNKKIESMTQLLHVKYINPGKVLLNKKHFIEELNFTDGLHPNAIGYSKLAAAIKFELDRIK